MENIMIIDTHCHLDFPDFVDDIDGVIARAHAVGVMRMITISTWVRKYETYKAIAEAHESVWFSVGTHPHQAHEEADVQLETLIELAAHPKCVAIGEAGLDYHYNYSPKDVAERVFRTHIAAARSTGLPLVIHSRDADDDMIRVLEDEMARGPFKALLHCFTGSQRLAQAGLDLGCYISFSGVVTFKKSTDLQAIAITVPEDRLLVETDAPFLAPVPHRGSRNEPSFVVETAKVLAQLKQMSFDNLTAITTQNAHDLFSKLPKIKT